MRLIVAAVIGLVVAVILAILGNGATMALIFLCLAGAGILAGQLLRASDSKGLRTLGGAITWGTTAISVWAAFVAAVIVVAEIRGRDFSLEDNSAQFVFAGVFGIPLVFIAGALFGWLLSVRRAE